MTFVSLYLQFIEKNVALHEYPIIYRRKLPNG